MLNWNQMITGTGNFGTYRIDHLWIKKKKHWLIKTKSKHWPHEFLPDQVIITQLQSTWIHFQLNPANGAFSAKLKYPWRSRVHLNNYIHQINGKSLNKFDRGDSIEWKLKSGWKAFLLTCKLLTSTVCNISAHYIWWVMCFIYTGIISFYRLWRHGSRHLNRD